MKGCVLLREGGQDLRIELSSSETKASRRGCLGAVVGRGVASLIKRQRNAIRLSASDLSNHLACHHLTSLDSAVSLGAKSAPAWHSSDARVLQERGVAHEDAYLAHLKDQRVFILNPPGYR